MEEKLSYKVRGAIFEVHKQLGLGLYEEVYEAALMKELELRGIEAKSQVVLPVMYKGTEIKEAYRVDILVEDRIIVELKSVDELRSIHFKQLNNYLHLSGLYLGFLVNFNCAYMKEGKDLCRVFNNEAQDKSDI